MCSAKFHLDLWIVGTLRAKKATDCHCETLSVEMAMLMAKWDSGSTVGGDRNLG